MQQNDEEPSALKQFGITLWDEDDLDFMRPDEGHEWKPGPTPVQPWSWVHLLRSQLCRETPEHPFERQGLQYVCSADDLYLKCQLSRREVDTGDESASRRASDVRAVTAELTTNEGNVDAVSTSSQVECDGDVVYPEAANADFDPVSDTVLILEDS